MAKKIKKVQARLEAAKDVNGNQMSILRIGHRTIGEIQTVTDRMQARSKPGRVFHVKNLSEGLRDLLADYHLHQKDY